jgi:hypothetical protein
MTLRFKNRPAADVPYSAPQKQSASRDTLELQTFELYQTISFN